MDHLPMTKTLHKTVKGWWGGGLGVVGVRGCRVREVGGRFEI